MPKGRVPQHERTCTICSERFLATSQQARCCSAPCRKAARRAAYRRYYAENAPARRTYYRELYRRDPQKVIQRQLRNRAKKRERDHDLSL